MYELNLKKQMKKRSRENKNLEGNNELTPSQPFTPEPILSREAVERRMALHRIRRRSHSRCLKDSPTYTNLTGTNSFMLPVAQLSTYARRNAVAKSEQKTNVKSEMESKKIDCVPKLFKVVGTATKRKLELAELTAAHNPKFELFKALGHRLHRRTESVPIIPSASPRGPLTPGKRDSSFELSQGRGHALQPHHDEARTSSPLHQRALAKSPHSDDYVFLPRRRADSVPPCRLGGRGESSMDMPAGGSAILYTPKLFKLVGPATVTANAAPKVAPPLSWELEKVDEPVKPFAPDPLSLRIFKPVGIATRTENQSPVIFLHYPLEGEELFKPRLSKSRDISPYKPKPRSKSADQVDASLHIFNKIVVQQKNSAASATNVSTSPKWEVQVTQIQTLQINMDKDNPKQRKNRNESPGRNKRESPSKHTKPSEKLNKSFKLEDETPEEPSTSKNCGRAMQNLLTTFEDAKASVGARPRLQFPSHNSQSESPQSSGSKGAHDSSIRTSTFSNSATTTVKVPRKDMRNCTSVRFAKQWGLELTDRNSLLSSMRYQREESPETFEARGQDDSPNRSIRNPEVFSTSSSEEERPSRQLRPRAKTLYRSPGLISSSNENAKSQNSTSTRDSPSKTLFNVLTAAMKKISGDHKESSQGTAPTEGPGSSNNCPRDWMVSKMSEFSKIDAIHNLTSRRYNKNWRNQRSSSPTNQDEFIMNKMFTPSTGAESDLLGHEMLERGEKRRSHFASPERTPKRSEATKVSKVPPTTGHMRETPLELNYRNKDQSRKGEVATTSAAAKAKAYDYNRSLSSKSSSQCCSPLKNSRTMENITASKVVSSAGQARPRQGQESKQKNRDLSPRTRNRNEAATISNTRSVSPSRNVRRNEMATSKVAHGREREMPRQGHKPKDRDLTTTVSGKLDGSLRHQRSMESSPRSRSASVPRTSSRNEVVVTSKVVTSSGSEREVPRQGRKPQSRNTPPQKTMRKNTPVSAKGESTLRRDRSMSAKLSSRSASVPRSARMSGMKLASKVAPTSGRDRSPSRGSKPKSRDPSPQPNIRKHETATRSAAVSGKKEKKPFKKERSFTQKVTPTRGNERDAPEQRYRSKSRDISPALRRSTAAAAAAKIDTNHSYERGKSREQHRSPSSLRKEATAPKNWRGTPAKVIQPRSRDASPQNYVSREEIASTSSAAAAAWELEMANKHKKTKANKSSSSDASPQRNSSSNQVPKTTEVEAKTRREQRKASKPKAVVPVGRKRDKTASTDREKVAKPRNHHTSPQSVAVTDEVATTSGAAIPAKGKTSLRHDKGKVCPSGSRSSPPQKHPRKDDAASTSKLKSSMGHHRGMSIHPYKPNIQSASPKQRSRKDVIITSLPVHTKGLKLNKIFMRNRPLSRDSSPDMRKNSEEVFEIGQRQSNQGVHVDPPSLDVTPQRRISKTAMSTGDERAPPVRAADIRADKPLKKSTSREMLQEPHRSRKDDCEKATKTKYRDPSLELNQSLDEMPSTSTAAALAETFAKEVVKKKRSPSIKPKSRDIPPHPIFEAVKLATTSAATKEAPTVPDDRKKYLDQRRPRHASPSPTRAQPRTRNISSERNSERVEAADTPSVATENVEPSVDHGREKEPRPSTLKTLDPLARQRFRACSVRRKREIQEDATEEREGPHIPTVSAPLKAVSSKSTLISATPTDTTKADAAMDLQKNQPNERVKPKSHHVSPQKTYRILGKSKVLPEMTAMGSTASSERLNRIALMRTKARTPLRSSFEPSAEAVDLQEEAKQRGPTDWDDEMPTTSAQSLARNQSNPTLKMEQIKNLKNLEQGFSKKSTSMRTPKMPKSCHTPQRGETQPMKAFPEHLNPEESKALATEIPPTGPNPITEVTRDVEVPAETVEPRRNRRQSPIPHRRMPRAPSKDNTRMSEH